MMPVLFCATSRNLSQTKWLVDGERKTATSIEELIGEPVKRLLRADRCVFTASGREDVDVKMLGSGRPFAVEVLNPRKPRVTTAELGMTEQVNVDTT